MGSTRRVGTHERRASTRAKAGQLPQSGWISPQAADMPDRVRVARRGREMGVETGKIARLGRQGGSPAPANR
jgi:hypothetical protein